MKLAEAQSIANKVVEQLRPFCFKIEVAGSIRRLKSEVKDIDIVLIPSDALGLNNRVLSSLGTRVMGGDKLSRFLVHGIQVDLYFATEDTWSTLLLIRTGSKENNIRLCSAAKKIGWKLCANGDGLFDENGNRIAGDSEDSIYQALGLPWQAPWGRR